VHLTLAGPAKVEPGNGYTIVAGVCKVEWDRVAAATETTNIGGAGQSAGAFLVRFPQR
jgi:hypothetical protein